MSLRGRHLLFRRHLHLAQVQVSNLQLNEEIASGEEQERPRKDMTLLIVFPAKQTLCLAGIKKTFVAA